MAAENLLTFYELTESERKQLSEEAQTEATNPAEDSTESECCNTNIDLESICDQLQKDLDALNESHSCFNEVMGIREDLNRFCHSCSELYANDIERFESIMHRISDFDITKIVISEELKQILADFRQRIKKQQAVELLESFKKLPLTGESIVVLDSIIELVNSSSL